MDRIIVKNIDVNITGLTDDDFISLTDLARIKNPSDPNGVIANWLRRIDTINFLSLWESMNNEDFKPTDFEGFKAKPGENAFTLSSKKWIELTNANGLRVKSGKIGGGTFAHHDIALEFGAWISPEVKLFIIKEFKRLKVQEGEKLEWQGKRFITKLNYLIHTESIKEHLVTVKLTESQKSFIYASEADLLNVALFGMTSKEWKARNPDKKGNIRDYANSIELTILSNLEFYNSKLISEEKSQNERLILLNIEANKEKEVFNRNNEKAIVALENKQET